MDESAYKVSLLTSVASSIISGFIYPVDLLNTIKKNNASDFDIISKIKSIHKKEGFYGYYRGTSLVIGEIFAVNFIYFYAYEEFGNKLKCLSKQLPINVTWSIPIINSFFSEVLCLSIYTPCETIITRIQSKNKEYHYKGFFDGLRQISQKEGFMRLYKSSPLFIVFNLTFTTTQFSIYEWLKSLNTYYTDDAHFSSKLSILSTLCSTSIAAILTNPIDTMVIKHQMINFEKEKKGGIFHLIKHEIEVKGRRSFTHGIAIRLLSANVTALSIIPFFEFFRQKYGIEMKN